MRAMRRTKRIVHVNLGVRRKLRSKAGIILLLAGMKSRIFQQQHLARRKALHLFGCCAAHTIRRKVNLSTEQQP